jgi:hypothetical protein
VYAALKEGAHGTPHDLGRVIVVGVALTEKAGGKTYRNAKAVRLATDDEIASMGRADVAF